MQRFYLVPIEIRNNTRGPKYMKRWGGVPDGQGGTTDPGEVDCQWSMMDYGFVPSGLVLGHDIDQTNHDLLIANIDVYSFPEILSGPVNDPGVDVFFEAINIPTDWLTPATTWIELLRQLAGMFLFNQRYSGISGGGSVFDNADLDTRLRLMTDQEQVWFLETVDSFGFDSSVISTNARLRLLVKQAGTFWEGQPLIMGGVEF